MHNWIDSVSVWSREYQTISFIFYRIMKISWVIGIELNKSSHSHSNWPTTFTFHFSITFWISNNISSQFHFFFIWCFSECFLLLRKRLMLQSHVVVNDIKINQSIHYSYKILLLIDFNSFSYFHFLFIHFYFDFLFLSNNSQINSSLANTSKWCCADCFWLLSIFIIK